jgi:hypothetical protein
LASALPLLLRAGLGADYAVQSGPPEKRKQIWAFWSCQHNSQSDWFATAQNRNKQQFKRAFKNSGRICNRETCPRHKAIFLRFNDFFPAASKALCWCPPPDAEHQSARDRCLAARPGSEVAQPHCRPIGSRQRPTEFAAGRPQSGVPHGHHHHHHSDADSGQSSSQQNPISTLFGLLGQDLQSGNAARLPAIRDQQLGCKRNLLSSGPHLRNGHRPGSAPRIPYIGCHPEGHRVPTLPGAGPLDPETIQPRRYQPDRRSHPTSVFAVGTTSRKLCFYYWSLFARNGVSVVLRTDDTFLFRIIAQWWIYLAGVALSTPAKIQSCEER